MTVSELEARVKAAQEVLEIAEDELSDARNQLLIAQTCAVGKHPDMFRVGDFAMLTGADESDYNGYARVLSFSGNVARVRLAFNTGVVTITADNVCPRCGATGVY